jgi:quercetin dioxygenase-like cupin family protein
MKVLKLEGESHSGERHDYAEALIVADGRMNLIVDGTAVAVNTGGMFVVPAGVPHSVGPGSTGVVVIVD